MDFAFAVRVPLEEVEREWLRRDGVDAVYAAARHYGIYRDLFREPNYFLPLVPLAVDYKYACFAFFCHKVITPPLNYHSDFQALVSLSAAASARSPSSTLRPLSHSEHGVLMTARPIVAHIQFAHAPDVRVQISWVETAISYSTIL